MVQRYKVRKFQGMPAKKAYAIFRAEDLKGHTGPIHVDDDDRPRAVMANMASNDASGWCRQLNEGVELGTVKYRRQCILNQMYSGSGMN